MDRRFAENQRPHDGKSHTHVSRHPDGRFVQDLENEQSEKHFETGGQGDPLDAVHDRQQEIQRDQLQVEKLCRNEEGGQENGKDQSDDP